MILNAIALDASMSAHEVLERLAERGLWLDPQHPAAQRYIDRFARLTGRSFADAVTRLARDSAQFGIAVRRQFLANIMWYPKRAPEVLARCVAAPPGKPLGEVLELHEYDSEDTMPMPAPGVVPANSGVIMEGDVVLGVSLVDHANVGRPAMDPGATGTRGSRGGLLSARSSGPTTVKAWPRLDAPQFTPAKVEFDVVVGFAREQQSGVVGNQTIIPVPAGSTTVEISVQLSASGIDAPAGWSRRMLVDARDPASASATFKLVGREPTGTEPVHLTMLEVRYVVNGEVCGTAARPLVILRSTESSIPVPVNDYGTPWLSQPATSSALTVTADTAPVDLTIEISKPDCNPARGCFVCRATSPHREVSEVGPFDIDFGSEAKGFAGSLIDRVRGASNNALIDNALESIGNDIAARLPGEVIDAIYTVAAKTAPNPPTVLVVSAEPYVPWELLRLDPPPVDPNRPPFLGAQVILGRWIREARGVLSTPTPSAPAAATATAAPRRVLKPPPMPPQSIAVKDMAVMAGCYKAASGFAPLPHAEAEAKALEASHDALLLAATPSSLKRLLDATLERGVKVIGGAGAVHFAGHGLFNAADPDSSVMYLSDGTGVVSSLFNSAKYGTPLQPLIFFNACMIGMGGELLGNAGGFPGNCLRGGFGGVLGALWEVDDAVAAQIAAAFWERALPKDRSKAEPVAQVLRDLRTQYTADPSTLPVSTYLSYVFYGHPRLTLQ